MATPRMLVAGQTCLRGSLPYAAINMAAIVGDLSDQQKEWFSRSFLVGVAAAAGCPVELRLNDVNGVDATVHDGGIQTDWQLKGTSSPHFSADGAVLYFDLDVRTYNLFTGDRNATAFLGVVVVPIDRAQWAAVSATELRLRHCGYWQQITGLKPTNNSSTVRIHIPVTQQLSVQQLSEIMRAERQRVCA